MPSAASALPKTSPTNREYAAQFVPNSNSMTMPVATPMANVRPKIRTKNFAICWYSGAFVARYIPSITTSSRPRPMDRGG